LAKVDLISVIVPVYNVEQYLLRCVDSIQKQTYQNLEIILVDDGSPDHCPQLCEQIKAQDSRVKVVHKKNGGLGFARNSGLDVATGDYVTFIDSDDWIAEDHLDNLYREAKRTQADAVLGAHTTAAADGRMYRHTIKAEQRVYEGADLRNKIILPLIGADVSCPQDIELDPSSCMNLYRRAVITENQLRFRSEKVAVSEDIYFNLDFFCHAERIAAMDESGYYYFENTASISRKYDPKRFDRTLRFYEILKEQIVQYGLEEQAALRLKRSFLMKVRIVLREIVVSDLSKKEKYSRLRCILEHDLVDQALKTYPVDTFIPAMRLLTKWMRSKKVRSVYYLIRVREVGKRAGWLKACLKRIGIGR
jgi:glycosyltransferase involved in cell wall biosynthesis